MKFSKAVMVGELNLDKEFQQRLDENIEKKAYAKDMTDAKPQLADSDALFVGFGTKVDKGAMDSAPKLKYVGVYATAYDPIDTEYAKSKNITVCNLGGYSTEGVAEFVFSMLLNHMRNIDRAKERIRKGDNEFLPAELAKNRELKDKVFGVIGLGRIGSRVSEIALGFGSDVRYWSRNRKKEFESKGVKYEDADSLIPKADILTLHLAVNDGTKGFLNADRIKKIKSGAILVSTVGLELIDVDALEERLEKNDITFIVEDSGDLGDSIKKLGKYGNCVVYPPVALTSESLVARQRTFVDNVEGFLKGKPQNKVN